MELKLVFEVIEKVTGSRRQVIATREQIPSQTPYIYVVNNGKDILQIGKTKGKSGKGRLVALLKGACPTTHNKSFIVGLASAVLDSVNQYSLFPITRQISAENAEEEIHRALGIVTNRTAAVFLSGIQCKSIKEANLILWERFLKTKYQLLDSHERIIADDFFRVINTHVVKIQRKKGKPSEYRSGDILAGSILAYAGFSCFPNLWQKICENYFHYTSHYLMPEDEYLNAIASYQSIYKTGDIMISAPTIKEMVRPSGDEKINDLVILKSQLERALDALNDPIISKESETADMIFETDNLNYIFLVTRPMEKKINKIEALLNDIDPGVEEVLLTELRSTVKKDKYTTQFSSCYVEHRVRGFQKGEDNRKFSFE